MHQQYSLIPPVSREMAIRSLKEKCSTVNLKHRKLP
jgi:hypothetical protein